MRRPIATAAGRLARSLLARLPVDEGIYAACKRYVDRYNGDNDCDMRTNGEQRLVASALGSGRPLTVFDVGANVGDWAKAALGANPSIALHCFEPSATTLERLRLAGLPGGVVLNGFGLGSRDEARTLHIFEDGSGMNSLYVRRGLEDRGLRPQEKTVEVRLRTLDGYCEERRVAGIDFMKMDVEGHELEVLRGACAALEAARIGVIQFEYGGCNIDSGALLRDLFGLLSAHGYGMFKLHPRRLQPIPAYTTQLETFQYANFVAVAPGKTPPAMG